ncbi:RpiB/LacA/LacB family sugar-phosphate isomerase [Candidatus Dojkabacteria bacterium]|nr:RpiB/LacA/LacB family sugar-phosphate isomerase [Candidatus Dojkabacteria bacterium]
MKISKIYIGADHRGFDKKELIKEYLEKNFVVEDKGAYELNPKDDYPDFAFKVAEEVSKNFGARGVLICGSSIGIMVAANKVKGIIASNPRTPKEAIIDRQHHNSNILCLSADFMKIEEMKNIIEIWLNTRFDKGRHLRRINKIFEYEEN